MNKLVSIIENSVGKFDTFSEIDSYVVANRIKKVLKEEGYMMVENMKEASDYFAKKHKGTEHVYETSEHKFNLKIDHITYNIGLHKYFAGSDRIYSVLVSEL